MFFVSANKLTTAANAILLQFTAPIYVALLGAYILKEPNTRLDWAMIAVVIGGMALFFLDQLSPAGFKGNLVAMLSGVSFAFFTIFMRMQKDGSPIESVLLGNILMAVVGAPFLAPDLPSAGEWGYLLLLGVVQLGIPYILYSWAIKHVKALDAALIPILEPLLNPFWVFLLLGEVPGPWSLAGGALLLTAVTIKCLAAIRK
jgi:drug/metabolite transporter (DMT)-like permease